MLDSMGLFGWYVYVYVTYVCVLKAQKVVCIYESTLFTVDAWMQR